MVTVDEMQRLLLAGADVVGSDGKKIGSVGQLFLDADSGDPAWVTVSTGLFGRGESFVPLAGAVAGERDLRVDYDKDQVKNAPRIESSDGSLSPAEERDLFRHYGLGAERSEGRDSDDRRDDRRDDRLTDARGDDRVGYDHGADDLLAGAPHHTPRHAAPPVAAGTRDDHLHAGEARPDDDDRDVLDRDGADRDALDRDRADRDDVRHDDDRTTAPATAGTTDEGMVLRAERAKVIGSERVPTERVRLRRYTVTENRTISVPVSREEYRVEYEPTAGDQPTGADRPTGADEPPARADDDRDDEPRHRR